MSVELTLLRRAYQRRTDHALAWKSSGGRVVGYVCDNVPAELIRAAGLLPFRLSGDHRSSREEIAERIVPYHARRFAGTEFIEAIFAGIVAGQYGFLDFLVVPHNRKIVGTLMQSVENLRPYRPQGTLPETWFLDRTFTRTFLTSAYNSRSLRQFAGKLEEWSGRPLDPARLQHAVAAANTTRSLLQQLAALRTRPDPRVSGVEALEIIGASLYLPAEEFNRLLAAFLRTAAERGPLAGLRVYLGGSPWDHLQFYEIVESAGAVIVAEDHCWGGRCADLVLEDATLEAMAGRFCQQSACSMLGSLDSTVQAVVNRTVASAAQAAIFSVIKGDLAQMWETPSELEALKAVGIPTLHLRNQPYHYDETDADIVRGTIARFVASAGPATAAVGISGNSPGCR